MQLKFEQKSSRTKGIAFHPNKPLLLASLHTGAVQLFNYKTKTLLKTFEEHEGAVRSVQFHISQPLFASGGDDFIIRIWNYHDSKSKFTLKGHLDFVRTVHFHNDLPWLLSASDDMTCRIWNWQSRNTIAILTGHNHYVMCAQFHPTKDLIVSCSLDQTLRLWNFSNLKLKNKKSHGEVSASEVELKCILEGHERGVNWCSFHATQNFIVSGSDDKKIKLWKYNDTKGWEFDCLYGHSNNVSCVLFHPTLDLIVSNSEDKTIRIWDLNNRTQLTQYKKDTDRYWILALHQSNSALIAAGNDNGTQIFSIFKDIIPVCLISETLAITCHLKQIFTLNLNTSKFTELISISDSNSEQQFNEQITQINFNPYSTQSSPILLITVKHKQTKKIKTLLIQNNQIKQIHNQLSGVFISNKKILRINEEKNVEIFSIDSNDIISTGIKAKGVWNAIGGKVLLQIDDQLVTYDSSAKKLQESYQLQAEQLKMKDAQWSKSLMLVAIVSKRGITILTKSLNKVTSISEKVSIKSVLWTKNDNVLLYTTNNHLKFLLLNGETGVIKSLEHNITLLRYESKNNIGSLQIMDQFDNVQTWSLNMEEVAFKLALLEKNVKEIQSFVQSNQSNYGNSIISYLHKKNHSQIALGLVKQVKERFQMAIECDNLEVALKCCQQLKDTTSFELLAEAAKRQGNYQIMELAYQNLKDLKRISFLYLLQGKDLSRAQNAAANLQDHGLNMQLSMFTGNIRSKVEILFSQGQLALAYQSAVLHHLTDLIDKIRPKLSEQQLENCEKYIESVQDKSESIIPPNPIIKNSPTASWPLSQISLQLQIELQDQDMKKIEQEIKQNEQTDLLYSQNVAPARQESEEQEPELELNEGNWGIDDDLQLDQEVTKDVPQEQFYDAKSNNQQSVDLFNIVNGFPQSLSFSKDLTPSQLIQVGNYSTLIQQLNTNYNISYSALPAIVAPAIQSSFQLISNIPYLRPTLTGNQNNYQSILSVCQSLQKQCYQLTTDGKFQDALANWQKLLQMQIILQDMEIAKICVNYIIAMKCELEKRKTANVQKQLELALYMASTNLQPIHKILSLKAAVNILYKSKQYKTCALVAKKQISMLDPKKDAQSYQQAQKVAESAEKLNTNAFNLDESVLEEKDFAYKICSKTLTLITEGKRCNFDQSQQSQEGMCEVCLINKI